MAQYFSKYLWVTLSDGSKKRLKFRGKTVEEAIEKRARAKVEYEMGVLILSPVTPFAKWVEEWLTTYKKHKQSNFTYLTTKSMINNVFVSEMGNMAIGDIKSTHLQKCLNKRSDKSQSNINKAYMYICDCFKKAYANGLIRRDILLDLEKPKGTTGQRRALTKEERDIFHKVVPKHQFGLFFAIMLGCGLRPGEVRALTWNDIQEDSINLEQL